MTVLFRNAFLVSSLLIAGMVATPTARAGAQIAVADTVRLRGPAGERLRGVVVGREQDSVTLRDDRGESVRLRLDSLRSVEVLRGRTHRGWRAVGWGAVIGGGAGLLLAPLVKQSDDRANEPNAGQGFDPFPHSLAFYEVATGTVGAVLGSIVGAAVSPLKVKRWVRVR